MREKDSSKSCGCFGSLFGKNPSRSRSRKGKNASGRDKIMRAASNHLLGSRKKSGSPKKAQASTSGVMQKVGGVIDKGVATTELQKKIISFRELVNLPPFTDSLTIIELVNDTVKELQKLHPDVVQSELESDSGDIHTAINELCESIKSLGKHWMHSDVWMVKSKKDDEANIDLEKHALDLLDDIIKVARERMDSKMDMDGDKEVKEEIESTSTSYDRKSSRRSNSDKATSPTTPTSILTGFPHNISAKMEHIKMIDEDDDRHDDGTNKDGLVRAQMEISVPPDLLKSIVDAGNVLIPTAGSPSSSLERPSVSATIVSPPKQMLVSEENQSQSPSPSPQPSGESEISPPALSFPPSLSVGESGIATPVPPPPPMTTSNTTSLSAPPPPPPPPKNSPDNSTLPQQVTSPARPPPPPPPIGPKSPPSSTPPPPGNNLRPTSPSKVSSNESVPPNNVAAPPPALTTPESNPPPSLPPLPPTAPGNAKPGSRGTHPPPPPPTAQGGIPPPPAAQGSVPPPPGKQSKGGAPPPPPALGGGKVLRKSVSKLKRSSQMGCLYRQLKAKVEGSNSKGPSKSPQKKGNKVGASTGNGKQGMADALAEMTKRSSYFQQIEEDVKNYSDAIKEVKVALAKFQTTDMDELIKFHKYVESHLEKLTDETQVLARFEDFPSKKLEGLRMAGALYSKLDTIATDLQNWKIEPPANDLLDRAENYFNKIKEDIDTLDRTKDDEIKKFKSQKIHFDFGILIRIKESMVDVSSGCMEMALKEKKESSSSKKNGKKTNSEKILWKAFQFAFRVYSFAGGQDERAENLTREIAQQIQAGTLQ